MAQHLSLRVPWHDDGWRGTVCKDPKGNVSCMRLKGVSNSRDTDMECENAHREIADLYAGDFPCIREGGAFMSPREHSVTISHPYAWDTLHKHLDDTTEIFPPFSYPARPYRWLMKECGNATIDDLAKEHQIDYDSDIEPTEKWPTNWVQHGKNQRAIFDTFFQDVVPEESFCVFYAKQVPFIEEPRRVIIGIGRVKKVIPAIDYKTKDPTDPTQMPSCTWETMIEHSIREDRCDGFLLPYPELMEYAKTNPSFDIRQATVFGSDDFREEFSYGAEHLSCDAMIDVILQCLKVMDLLKRLQIPGNWDACTDWLNRCLDDVWKNRGPFPGLGAMLAALFSSPSGASGVAMAKEMHDKYGDEEDVWQLLDRVMKDPKKLLPISGKKITARMGNLWEKLPKERRELFRLLARIDLSIPQAEVIYHSEKRKAEGIDGVTDADILKNPYLLYECTRDKEDALKISIKSVDYAMFPSETVLKRYPINPPSAMEDEADPRRVRALTVRILEEAAQAGNTILPTAELVIKLDSLAILPPCPMNTDAFYAMKDDFQKDDFQKGFCVLEEKGTKYCKLQRYIKLDDAIKRQVDKRIGGIRHDVNVNWEAKVAREFGDIGADATEQEARREKASALKILSEARVSVLVGGAGTGKTTVLSILCQQEEIRESGNGGILLLAPTGKARVRMAQLLKGKAKFEAKTVAQFLIKKKMYNPKTFAYTIEEDPDPTSWAAVIIDEASMLTEDMFGAVIAGTKKAQRIIFVGDANQLPPIGAGRPFLDLVRYLKSNPKGKNCYAELHIPRRQSQNGSALSRADVRLARWFTDAHNDLDDSVFAELDANKTDGTVVLRKWNDQEDLKQKLMEAVAEAAGMDGPEDLDGFNRSLGGTQDDKKYWYFNLNLKGNNVPGCAQKAEDWQILSPVRNCQNGTLEINQWIHEQYRKDYMKLAERTQYQDRKIPKKAGPENIVYGDKVINVVNDKRGAWPKENAENYVANGEIGMVAGHFGDQKSLKYLHVEYATQLWHNYSYEEKEFSDDSEIKLELAYALTVHKAQGSQFKTVILVLDDNCFMASREMLYTALTRQQDRLILLYNADAFSLQKHASGENSEVARRLTDLFVSPSIEKIEERYYEKDLIHKTEKGIMVRSKSEIIIADKLYEKGIEFDYEKKLPLGDSHVLPDFTIEDAASGKTIIWEHCGMMGNPEYRKRWENKKRLYEENGYTEDDGTLIVTQDGLDGSLDAQNIANIVEKLSQQL